MTVNRAVSSVAEPEERIACPAQFLLVFRGLVGLGLGGAPVAFALYLEFAPSQYRGALLVALQAFWTVGSMVEVRL